MTLILKLDLDMVKMYHHTKNEVSMSRHSKATAQTDIQTDTYTESMKTLPSRHTQAVNMHKSKTIYVNCTEIQ